MQCSENENSPQLSAPQNEPQYLTMSGKLTDTHYSIIYRGEGVPASHMESVQFFSSSESNAGKTSALTLCIR